MTFKNNDNGIPSKLKENIQNPLQDFIKNYQNTQI